MHEGSELNYTISVVIPYSSIALPSCIVEKGGVAVDANGALP
jgi:hypothetical protein